MEHRSANYLELTPYFILLFRQWHTADFLHSFQLTQNKAARQIMDGTSVKVIARSEGAIGGLENLNQLNIKIPSNFVIALTPAFGEDNSITGE